MAALLYHHSRSIKYCYPETVTASCLTEVLPEPDCKARTDCLNSTLTPPSHHLSSISSSTISDFEYHQALDFKPAYKWIAEKVGFWPLWLAVGRVNSFSTLDIAAGYRNQFQAGEELSLAEAEVLFSWDDLNPVFLAYENWHIVLNSINYPGLDQQPHTPRYLSAISPQIESWIFRRSWAKQRWIKEAISNNDVQAVTDSLDLSSAQAIRCPNQAVANELESRGFLSERLLVRHYSAPERLSE